jgi:GntR family transcriptional regulator, transcriptional repressor for pyruvate dehydrogenase complex
MPSRSPSPKARRSLADDLVESIVDRIRDGRLATGTKLPTEAEVMAQHAVSRTVVREALSKLQAAGQVLTRHGVGTFVVGPAEAAPFRVAPEQLANLQDVIALLELRLGLETEAAALAAERRNRADLREMRSALREFAASVESGQEAVAADVRFHRAIARATRNRHFADLMGTLGGTMIPRARLDAAEPMTAQRRLFLRRVLAEHESICDAIAAGDRDAARAAMRTHLSNSRERRRRAPAVTDPPARAARSRPAEPVRRPATRDDAARVVR